MKNKVNMIVTELFILSFLASGPAAADPLRFEASHEFNVAAPIERVFPLFTPDGESDWAPEWTPTPVMPETIRAETNAVFLTDGQGGKVIWTMLSYDPENLRVEYLATDPSFQQRWITVQCESLSDELSSVRVTYVSTALSDDGAAKIQKYDEDFIRQWEVPVRKYAIDGSL